MNKLRLLLAGAALALALAAGASAASSSTNLSLVAYSTPKTVMGKIIQAWQKTGDGDGVSFSQSYGASTDQARAVANGLKADLVFLSTGTDVNLLVDAGQVDSKWNRQSYRGIAADTLVVFAVRPGNPKKVKGWADLLKPGIQVVTPNPFSSGSAKWNVLAAYGFARKSGMSNKKAIKFVTNVFRHVVSQDSSGSNAANTFFSGKGDVLITYESEAYSAFAAGKQGKLVVPKPTMLIQLPMVPTKGAPSAAKAFIKYVHAPKQQKIFALNGYRPVVKSVLKSRDLASWRHKYKTGATFSIRDKLFGGWRKANKVWFDLSNGRMVAIERAVGGPTH
jgi:sulfate transport system substrate-binding protein